MRRLIVCLVVFALMLTSCAYIGATEDILISSPSTSTEQSSAALSDETATPQQTDATDETSGRTVILNKNSKKIHYFDTCSYAGNIKEENKSVVPYEQCASLLSEGYTVCSWCEKQSEKS